MRVLVTGAGGFVGRWLTPELESAGHVVVAAPPRRDLDLAARPGTEEVANVAAAVARLVAESRPDAVAHLAGMAYGPDAAADPAAAIAANAGGTAAVLDGLDEAGSMAVVLVASSADVYGAPTSLPIREEAPLRAHDAYGRSKVEQERVALEHHSRHLLIARSFNHTGPGQRASFAAPALARRVLALQRGEAPDIPVGNLDARRDFTDVRDVVRAYRLLLEGLASGDVRVEPPVVNVGSGHSVAIRDVLETLCRLAGIPVRTRVDPALLRANDTHEIYGDVTRLEELTGWRPTIPLERTLADLLRSVTNSTT